MSDYIRANLEVLVPTLLPVGFLFANLVIKGMLGQTNFHFFGSDMALCGCAVYTGTFLRQLLLHHLTDSKQIALNILGLLGVMLIWFICARLGGKSKWWLSLIAAMAGMAIFSLSDAVSWNMLSIGGSK